MRIGMFAKSNNLSIDTVRYYIDLKLIHPIRKGKYYYFEKEQQEQLNRLLFLKKLHFTLEEIKKIISFEKLSKIETTIKSNIYEDMLLEKRNIIEKQINELSEALEELDNEIMNISKKQNANIKEQGIAFKSFELICCPKCGEEIEFVEGVLRGNGIIEGKGICNCGYSLLIKEGIILLSHNSDNIIDPYIENHNQLDEFINETPKSFVESMMYFYEEIVRLLSKKLLSDKALLFMKSGLGPLELSLLERTTDIKLMILVDDDFNKLRIAKKSIEKNFPNNNVLYICSELNELPLKKRTIDIVIDFVASFIHGFRIDDNLYEYIIPILKEKSSIIGLYLHFKQFNMLSRLTENKRKLFNGSVFKNIASYSYVESSDYEEIILHEGTNINDFFKEGDKVHAKLMFFDRSTKK